MNNQLFMVREFAHRTPNVSQEHTQWRWLTGFTIADKDNVPTKSPWHWAVCAKSV